jgi:hypothetical protein
MPVIPGTDCSHMTGTPEPADRTRGFSDARCTASLVTLVRFAEHEDEGYNEEF